jgi:hypothetical protein
VTRHHGWLDAATPKPRPAPEPALGTGKGPQRDAKPIGLSSLRLDRLQHAGCVDHVEVEGLRTPVCIRRGDDVEAIVAEARELSGRQP